MIDYNEQKQTRGGLEGQKFKILGERTSWNPIWQNIRLNYT